jgi:hypothetical protein
MPPAPLRRWRKLPFSQAENFLKLKTGEIILGGSELRGLWFPGISAVIGCDRVWAAFVGRTGASRSQAAGGPILIWTRLTARVDLLRCLHDVEQVEQNDDRDRDSEKPKQNCAHHIILSGSRAGSK